MKNLIEFIKTTIRECLNENVDGLDEYIYIKGIKRSTKNSNGDFISNNIESISNFYNWFGESKTVDSKKRPIVYYHVSNAKFNKFNPSKFGKMGSGIYFTSIYSDIKQHDKYDGLIVYECYLRIENPLEIENPFSKRNDDNDGIIAFKGRSGEEVKVYVSNQIKSIDNDGSWSVGDDNIFS
jgi:hypothetical protein